MPILVEEHGDRCAYCGVSDVSQVDHIWPFKERATYPYGPWAINDDENLAAASVSCNVHTSGRHPAEWPGFNLGRCNPSYWEKLQDSLRLWDQALDMSGFAE